MGFGGPFAALPPMPAANAGLPTGPNLGAQLAQAVEKFPQQQADAAKLKMDQQAQKMALDKQKAETEAVSSAQAMQKLGLYYRMASGDPTGARLHDPNFIKAVNDAAKDAGIGALTHIDPTTGAEVLDVAALQHLVSSKLFTDLTGEQQKTVFEAEPGQQRTGILAGMGVDPATVPKETMDMRQWVSPAQQIKLKEDFIKGLRDYAMGNQTAGGLQAILSTLGTQAGMSIDDIKAMISSPDFTQQISPLAQAKVEQMRTLGIKDEALSAYYKQKTIDEPKEIASKIQYRNGQLILGQERVQVSKDRLAQDLTLKTQQLAQQSQRIQAYVKSVNANINIANQKQGLNGLKISLSVLQAQKKPLLDKQKELQALASSYITSRPDHQIPDEILQQMEQIKSDIDAANVAETQALRGIHDAENANFSRAVGKPATISHYYPKDSAVPGEDGYTFTGERTADGGYVVVGPDGKKRGWRP